MRGPLRPESPTVAGPRGRPERGTAPRSGGWAGKGLLLLLCGALGCVKVPAGPGRLAGWIEVDPRAGAPTLRTPEGASVALAGEAALLAELARIPGGRVRVAGPRHDSVLRVDAWELVDPGDGMVPYVGILEVAPGRVALRDERTGGRRVLQGEVVRDIRRHAGARVWVTGVVAGGGRIEVVHYGVLRDPPP